MGSGAQVGAVSSDEEDPVAWLRQRIAERLYLARNAIELGNAAVWTESSTGVLVTGEPGDSADAWHGTWAMGDSSLTRLIEANDPRDTIARCEMEMAILDEHGWVWEDYRDGDGIERMSRECVTCQAPGTPDDYPCHTVRLLLRGYRHHSGYGAEWQPA